MRADGGDTLRKCAERSVIAVKDCLSAKRVPPQALRASSPQGALTEKRIAAPVCALTSQ